MQQSASDLLKMTVARLIAEGEKVLKTKFDAGMGSVVYMGGRPTDVDVEKFAKWQAAAKTCYGCSATQQSPPWKEEFYGNNKFTTAQRMVGVLRGIA